MKSAHCGTLERSVFLDLGGCTEPEILANVAHDEKAAADYYDILVGAALGLCLIIITILEQAVERGGDIITLVTGRLL